MLGGWDKPEVAQAQRDLVLKELQHARDVEPFAAFDWAIGQISLFTASLLDVGCGVGHYAILCERNHPRVAYTGTDASAAIIAEARQLAPLAKFDVRDFSDNDFEDYDIVMASQCVETLPDPMFALEILLKRCSRYIILNRIRLTEPRSDPSHAIEEGTYCGNVGRNWLWNEREITSFIGGYANIAGRYGWDNQICLVLKKGD